MKNALCGGGLTNGGAVKLTQGSEIAEHGEIDKYSQNEIESRLPRLGYTDKAPQNQQAKRLRWFGAL